VAPPGIVDLTSLTGSYFPFHTTEAARVAAGDTRPSRESLYRNQAGYVSAVTTAANGLVAQRFLLQRDADLRIQQAASAAVLPQVLLQVVPAERERENGLINGNGTRKPLTRSGRKETAQAEVSKPRASRAVPRRGFRSVFVSISCPPVRRGWWVVALRQSARPTKSTKASDGKQPSRGRLNSARFSTLD